MAFQNSTTSSPRVWTPRLHALSLPLFFTSLPFPSPIRQAKQKKRQKGKHYTRKTCYQKETQKKRHSHELFFLPSKGNPGENRDKACDIYAAFSPFLKCSAQVVRCEKTIKKKTSTARYAHWRNGALLLPLPSLPLLLSYHALSTGTTEDCPKYVIYCVKSCSPSPRRRELMMRRSRTRWYAEQKSNNLSAHSPHRIGAPS